MMDAMAMHAAEAETRTRPAARPAPPTPPTPWNVVLLDDDDHTYEYVIEMAQRVFRVSAQRALEIARTVDEQGRAVCITTHREHAELKREQILSFGADPRLSRSAGAMSAIIEPASGGDDGEGGEAAGR